jgi:hypothetical protein
MGFAVNVSTLNKHYSESTLIQMHLQYYMDIHSCDDCKKATAQKCLNCYKALLESKNNIDFMILFGHKKYNPLFEIEDYLNLGMVKNYEFIGDEKKECSDITEGTILALMNWHLMYNDFSILGAVDGKKDFILVLNSEENLFEKELIWSKNTHQKPNTLGRELFMLSLAGYKMAPKSPSREIHFLPPSEGGKIDLEDFNRKFNEISKNEVEFFKLMRAFLNNDKYFTK